MVSRLPRFRRVALGVSIQLTQRDHAILRLLQEHRFLRSSHICALLGGSKQQILRRLQSLYHNGYVERPRPQIEYFHSGGSREMVYELGGRANGLLLDECGRNVKKIGSVFLQHELLVSDVMVSIELACRERGIRLLKESELASIHKGPFEWRVRIQNRMSVGVIPDRVFALEFPNADGRCAKAYFFLEADRGTMPVIRSNPLQTSFQRKLRAYETTWAQSLHQKRFGFNRFRVLTVTTSAARVDSLLSACASLQNGKGLFLFADTSILKEPTSILSRVCRSGKTGELSGLLD